ncbi:unnamed protein product [Bursaphelenchus okinawaensis]|uniref:Moesin/ezrin/radixin homolog 1 n=1 Tax=Bursaphelenchus okinawaensis TaxID=465554 RepID=A0A811KHV0_9BILA|nr:unnamed protein product [Bursaphelenchus okinawaensis]CAG9104908.1 unnamed protein product [Bursaphelenchus okinawaensis]
MFSLFSSRKKVVPVRVTTMDADITAINIEPDWTGRQLFDAVCRIIGLREIWYFGLQFVNKSNISVWLQMEKLIAEQNVIKDDSGAYHFYFLVKFFPESVEEELIQDITRHLFFLQIKQSILKEDLYCQAEAAVLLASYAVQAMYGDASEDIELELDKLLPSTVISHYHMSKEMWEERLRKWWANNSGLSTEDAEMEYLRVAQDLDMYGIQYYPIYNQKDTNLLLGVSAQGIGIYETHNRLSPRPFFPWSEIKNISFKSKEFCICNVDKSKLKFRAQEMSINMSILDLCIGTHNLYLRRRQPDLLEVQQMKIQAKEQRQKRLAEQTKLLKERERRIQAEAERDKYKNEVAFMSEQLTTMQDFIKTSDESHRLATEKLEQETLAYSKRCSEAEAEVQRVKLSKVQDDRFYQFPSNHAVPYDLNPKRFRSQVFINELVQYAPPYGNENVEPQLRHSHSTMHHLSQTSEMVLKENFVHRTASNGMTSSYIQEDEPPVNNNGSTVMLDEEIQDLCAEIEKTKIENSERNRELKERLSHLRQEIDVLKKQDSITEHDRVHANNVQMGLDKYSALRKVGQCQDFEKGQQFFK